MKYILNPGDFQDVRIVELREATSLKGELYRVDSDGNLEHYDRSTGNWYELDREQQMHVQIKVLQAAGLHP